MKSTERIVVRGLVAGFIAATVLALWFLVIDWLQGRPLYTPAFLASILAHVEGVDRSVGLIIMYTALHYGVFLVIGVGVAWLLSRLETAPGILLGLVLGFLLFDLIFYFGILYNSVDIVRELGWPELLAGNLLAGVSVMGYLHLSSGRPRVTWWEALAEHRIIREGVVAGLIGAAAVAVWFLIFDVVRAEMFFTPGALGSALFLGVNDLAEVQVNALTVVGYTAAHVGAFAVAGLVAAAIVVQAERTPPLLLGALLLFVAFEAFFIGGMAIAAEWLLGALAWWTVAIGNLVATLAMAAYLWRMHPDLRDALRADPFEPSWAEDDGERARRQERANLSAS